MQEKPWYKHDIAKYLAKTAKQYKTEKEALKAVNAVFDALEQKLSQDEEVVISGFGRFRITGRTAHQGRDPSTGREVYIAATRSVGFKPSENLKKAVNSSK